MTTSLELAITAIRSNRKDEGRQLLNLLIQENPNNESAWLWMSSVVNTDEQRARCLYHVLAINPDNQVARRGLQVLGIVVSDSRPVKVPRDSQPISIPQPSPPHAQFIPDTQPLEQKPESEPATPEPLPAAERRPFRVDRQAIVDELPFKPITKPFTDVPPPAAATAVVASAPSAVDPARQTEQGVNPSEPVPIAQTPDISGSETAGQLPSTEPTPTSGAQEGNPSEPVPVVQSGPAGPESGTAASPTSPSQPMPAIQSPGTDPAQPRPDSGPYPVPAQQPTGQPGQYYPPQSAPAPPQFVAGPMPPTDTQPPQPAPMIPYQQNPSQPVPVAYPNAAPGMSTQPVPGYYQPAAPIHSNTTMSMPTPNQAPGTMSGQSPPPSEPVPVVPANTPMGTPGYGQLYVQQPLPQNQAIHSNSTMMMPVGSEPVGTPANQPGTVNYPAQVATGAQANQAKGKNDDEDEEEINILAVIIFGSLSVTALGGLGMLILLMFAA